MKQSDFYRALRIFNDYKAVRNRRVGKRVARRVYGKLTGRLAGRLFR